MELKDIDLNLLVVFNQLLIERRVSKVADKLCLSQPAVSNALARLRKLTDDTLFLRTTRGMEPTPYARQLAEPVAYALGMIHSAPGVTMSTVRNTNVNLRDEMGAGHVDLAIGPLPQLKAGFFQP